MSVRLTVDVPQDVVDRFRPRGQPETEWRTSHIVPLDLFASFLMCRPPVKLEMPSMPQLRYDARLYSCRCPASMDVCMSRLRRMRDRAKRCNWLLAREIYPRRNKHREAENDADSSGCNRHYDE